MRTRHRTYDVFSIPLWCDWDAFGLDASFSRIDLSIPLWCDWDGAGKVKEAALSVLSIPLWCDWDTASLSPYAMAPRPFNPTVVRLGQGALDSVWHEMCLFQSHCGAIGTP